MAAKASMKRGLLPGYFESVQEKESKERYLGKVKSIEGQDPYEISRKEWIDDVDCLPEVTYINVGMYLLFAASPYTQEQLMNYKSLDCYQNFANGWVREVLCKKLTCECCGAGGCETKCPFCHKDDDISAAKKDKTFCLEETAGGYRLKGNHQYYYRHRNSWRISPEAESSILLPGPVAAPLFTCSEIH